MACPLNSVIFSRSRMWEGPSWLSDRQEVLGQSPPTKWPRITTPPNRRQSILSDPNDSGLGDSFYSPPLAHKKTMRISPLRTPGSNKSTFSPFGRIRLSSFSSPTLSDRALRLSNSDNVLDYKFCEENLEKNRGRVDIGKVASNAARSLNLPGESTEKRVDESTDVKPDAALLSMLETPSKGFNFEDSGVFDETLNMNFQFATSPLKHLFLDFDTPQPGPSSMPDPHLDPFSDESTRLAKRVKTEVEVPPASENVFAMPAIPSSKRFLAPYSRRWFRYTTGGTRVQREITSAAHAFLARRRTVRAGPPRSF